MLCRIEDSKFESYECGEAESGGVGSIAMADILGELDLMDDPHSDGSDSDSDEEDGGKPDRTQSHFREGTIGTPSMTLVTVERSVCVCLFCGIQVKTFS